MAKIAGATILAGEVEIPDIGAWVAHVRTTTDAVLPVGSRVSVELADLALSGTILRGSATDGSAAYLVVGGAGKWGSRSLPARSYRNDAGVKMSTVITDLGRESGETIVAGYTDRTLGPAWTRAAGVGAAALRALAPWWLDAVGKTHIGSRETGDLTLADVHKVGRNDARGLLEIQTPTIAAIVPRLRFDARWIRGVLHVVSGASITTRLRMEASP